MKDNAWTDDMIAVLEEKIDTWTQTQIAEYLGVPFTSVQAKMQNLGIFKDDDTPYLPLCDAYMPMFEDVTREEARRISAGSPPCGKFKRVQRQDFSVIGNSGQMCAA